MPYLLSKFLLQAIFADMAASVHECREKTSMGPCRFRRIRIIHRMLSTIHPCLFSTERIYAGTDTMCSNIRTFRNLSASAQAIQEGHPYQSLDI